MATYECLVCGWCYDEARGLPEDGIAPATAWDELPPGWMCPICGVGREDFAKREV